MEMIRIGLFGASRGMDFVKRVLRYHPQVKVTAVCEGYAPLLGRAVEELNEIWQGARGFSDFDEMMTSGIDAVILANHANDHARYAIKALEAGIHVFSEVLPTQTPAEAVALCEAVEKSGKVYAYGENYVYFSPTFELRRLFETGIIGKAVHVEGNFINDCSRRWQLLTRGDRNHWRNYVPSTFYCTHSIGPMLAITGERALNVIGMETSRLDYMAEGGARSGSAAMEIMQLVGGGMAKSINGNFKRDFAAEYRIIGETGTIETDPYNPGWVQLYTEVGNTGRFEHKAYKTGAFEYEGAKPILAAHEFSWTQYGDLYPLCFFIGSILGDEVAKHYTIDIYRALDMSLPGLFAYRSILAGSAPVTVPDFRDPAVRETYRHDNACTDPEIAGDSLLPSCKTGTPEVDEAVYEKIRNSFASKPLTTGAK